MDKFNKFNFLKTRTTPTEIPPKDVPVVRTRATGEDRYAGLRGHAYITARRLDTPVQTSALLKKWG